MSLVHNLFGKLLIYFSPTAVIEKYTDQRPSSDHSQTGGVDSFYEKSENEDCANKESPSKTRKPSGESSTTELSSITTSTPSSSPLVSAPTSISSALAACDEKGGANSPLSEENIDLSSCESLDTKNQASSENDVENSGDTKTDVN